MTGSGAAPVDNLKEQDECQTAGADWPDSLVLAVGPAGAGAGFQRLRRAGLRDIFSTPPVR